MPRPPPWAAATGAAAPVVPPPAEAEPLAGTLPPPDGDATPPPTSVPPGTVGTVAPAFAPDCGCAPLATAEGDVVPPACTATGWRLGIAIAASTTPTTSPAATPAVGPMRRGSRARTSSITRAT